MQLKESEIKSQSELNNLLGTLGAARIRKDIKIIHGSLDGEMIVDVTFRVKQTDEVWNLYCVNEAKGGGYLRKV